MVGLKSEDVEIFLQKLCVFGKTTPYGEILKIMFQKVTASPIDVLCSNCVKFDLREIGKIVRYLPDRKQLRLTLPLSLLR